jgi:polysaccharide deacetylase 2 family uncharacterized protein YibQ
VADDLSAPLGQKTPKKHAAIPAMALRATAAALGVFLLAFVVWAAVVSDPLGGEPVARVPVDLRAGGPDKNGERADAKQESHSKSAGPSVVEAPSGESPASSANSTASPGNQTVTIIDGSSGKRQEVSVPGSAEAMRPGAIDSRLLETTRHGQIPRVGIDGARVSEVYARPVNPAKADGPRIAIVVEGLAVGAATTAEALAKLPGPVTFAFAPYATDVDRLVARARGEGHEVLLQLPMEPFDYPDNDPGPRSLLTSLAPEQNIDRLQWLMSRFQGYVGVANYMGSRFTANDQALAPVLREIAKRGLIYLDDGTSPRSLAGQIAGANMLPYAKAAMVLDAVPTPTEIDRSLQKLEGMAREKGVVVGVVNALPVSLDRLSLWAKSAESRGFVLVPISAAAIKPKAS